MYADSIPDQCNSSGLAKSMCMRHGNLLALYDMPTTKLIFMLGRTRLVRASSHKSISYITFEWVHSWDFHSFTDNSRHFHVKNINKFNKNDV